MSAIFIPQSRRLHGLAVRAALLSLTWLAASAGAQEREAQPASQGRAAPAAIFAAGEHSIELSHAGLARKYLVHVPRSYRPDQAAPLLLALHGGGGHAQLQADDKRYGLISKSESAGFVAVFPNGFSQFPGGRLATWNAGQCCGEARDRRVDDVGFIRAVVADVQKRLNIAPQRIYATGMSNGAMLAHRLACEASDLFAGIAAVAGTDNTVSCSPSRPILVLMIHARDDDHVLFGGGAGPQAFRDRSKVSDFVSVPETQARWARRNQCPRPASRVLALAGAFCERQDGCSEGAAVQLCVTESGGHSWPGGGKTRWGKEPASTAVSANDLMWDFFQRGAADASRP